MLSETLIFADMHVFYILNLSALYELVKYLSILATLENFESLSHSVLIKFLRDTFMNVYNHSISNKYFVTIIHASFHFAVPNQIIFQN